MALALVRLNATALALRGVLLVESGRASAVGRLHVIVHPNVVLYGAIFWPLVANQMLSKVTDV